MNFELTEALAYWESVKGSRAMHGEQIAEQPATGVDEWPDSLPCLMVADLQWRADGDNNANRHTFSILATKLSGGVQRTDWTVPDCYRYPENMVSLQSITADIASQIISGMRLQPDRLIQAWFNARCTAPAQTPPVETVEQRRTRYLALFETEQKRDKRGALQRVADSEGVDRSNLKKDIDRARAARDTEKRAGIWASQLVTDGKRKG